MRIEDRSMMKAREMVQGMNWGGSGGKLLPDCETGGLRLSWLSLGHRLHAAESCEEPGTGPDSAASGRLVGREHVAC